MGASSLMDAFLVKVNSMHLSEMGFADSEDAVGKFKALTTDTTINISTTKREYHK